MVTELEFQTYVECQMSGVTNMFDVNRVCQITGLTREQCFDIMKNYVKYQEEFK